MQAQTYTDWRHLIAIDAGTYELGSRPQQQIVYASLPQTTADPSVHRLRQLTPHLRGEYVAQLNDDDAWLPHHLATMVAALESSGADFAWSKVGFYLQGKPEMVIGSPAFALGCLDSAGTLIRREWVERLNWPDSPGWDVDFRNLETMRAQGARGVFVNQITAEHHDGWLARQRGLPY